jgi:aminoglycoside phosphotransferase (APT) family kinase protein
MSQRCCGAAGDDSSDVAAMRERRPIVGGGRPPAEVRIDAPLVRRLVSAQFPQWAQLAVSPVESSGWDNEIYRLGDDLAVRLPRRRIGAGHTEKEHSWLPVLGPQLPLAVPVPVGKGVPGEGYPWRWTVCPWLPGQNAAVTPVADMSRLVMSLAGLVQALRAIDPAGGPVSEFRDGPLVGRDPAIRTAVAELWRRLDVHPLLAVWEKALAAPAWTGPPVWIHGDLHPANLLISNDELTAVIDFGLLGVGDPACDLIVAWTYLSGETRQAFRAALAVDDPAWARGQGWALDLGLRVAAYAADNPVLGAIGRHTIAELLADSWHNH